MKIIYKEFNTEFRGEIDIMPEKSIECETYKDIADNILKLLNSVKPGHQIKITSIDCGTDSVEWEAGIIPLVRLEYKENKN